MNVQLRDYQAEAMVKIRSSFKGGNKRVMVYSPTGCHAKGTPILMADGTNKKIELLRVGDLVMGPDSKPRKLLDLHQGKALMYKIVPIKGDTFDVNEDHVLSLKNTVTRNVINITVREWLGKSKTFKHLHKLWRTGVDFEERKLDVPPYIMGVLLGDGCITQTVAISNPDPEIEEEVTAYASSMGCYISNRTYESSNCRAYAITSDKPKNAVTDLLRGYGIFGKSAEFKFIPKDYLINNRENRLEILAGLLDTDGYLGNGVYEYVSKSKILVESIAFLCRSLGLACYYHETTKSWQNGTNTYWIASISGHIDEIPCRVERKKASPRLQIKSVNVTGFSVEPIGYDDYFGFECDGDHLYLLGDFTVTHNSGKGELAVALAQLAQINGKKVLFLVHRKDLVKQQWERFAKYQIFPGVLQGQNTNKPHSAITVGSIQTFASRKKFGWQFDFDMIIIDEAHLCGGGKQYHEFLRTHSNLPVIGLTATPFAKGLGKNMGWGRLFEDFVMVSTIQDLINKGFLVDCEIYAPSEPDLSKVRVVAGDYHQKQLGEAVNKTELVGDIVKHWFKLGDNKQTIVFATNIDHSKSIVQQFTAHGISAEHVDCYSKEEHRNRAIDRFRSGEIKILSNVALFAEGFDAPETACMILARPTRSLIRYIQMIGRVLRPAEGKEMAIVLDHSGSVSRLGFPTDDLPLHLDTGNAADAPKKENKPKEPKICVSCKYVDKRRQHTCPKCGFAPVAKTKGIEPTEGTLQKIVKMPHEAKQQIYSALVAFAAMKNYQSGWIFHKFKRITGVWPRDLKPEPGPIPDFVHKIIISEQIKYSYSKKRAA